MQIQSPRPFRRGSLSSLHPAFFDRAGHLVRPEKRFLPGREFFIILDDYPYPEIAVLIDVHPLNFMFEAGEVFVEFLQRLKISDAHLS